ncbi:MAG: hypothetical protein HN790_02355 [Methylococcales bacterium]|nr:hypothetical protein [Methylococcales bacterium]
MKNKKYFYITISKNNCDESTTEALLEFLEQSIRALAELPVKHVELEKKGFSISLKRNPQNIKISTIDYWQARLTSGQQIINVSMQLSNNCLD